MSPYHLALVLARGAGVVIVIASVPSFVIAALNLLQWYAPNWLGQSMLVSAYGWTYWVGSLLMPVVGVALFMGAPRVARLLARGCYAAGCCQHCGYRGARGEDAVCPECGHTRTPASEAGR